MVVFEASVYAELPAPREEVDWPFPEPSRLEEVELFNSLPEGAVNALRARPLAEDATLLIMLLIADGAGVSSCFECSAALPLPFGSLMFKYIEFHDVESED